MIRLADWRQRQKCDRHPGADVAIVSEAAGAGRGHRYLRFSFAGAEARHRRGRATARGVATVSR